MTAPATSIDTSKYAAKDAYALLAMANVDSEAVAFIIISYYERGLSDEALALHLVSDYALTGDDALAAGAVANVINRELRKLYHYQMAQLAA